MKSEITNAHFDYRSAKKLPTRKVQHSVFCSTNAPKWRSCLKSLLRQLFRIRDGINKSKGIFDAMNEYKPYFYTGQTMLLERYLILGEVRCPQDCYDIFDMELNGSAEAHINNIEADGYDGFQVLDDLNREGLNHVKNYDNPKDKKIFIYTEVFCEKKTRVIINISCLKNGKLWVNAKCLAIHYVFRRYCLAVDLNKGKNVFVLEIYSPEPYYDFNIQLLDYTVQMGNGKNALLGHDPIKQIDNIVFISEPYVQFNASRFRFMFMILDGTRYNPEYRIEIYDSNCGLVKTMQAMIHEVVELDLSGLRCLHAETLRREWIECVFKDADQKEHVIGGPWLFLNDFEKRRLEVNSRLQVYEKELGDAVAADIRGTIDKQEILKSGGDMFNLFLYTGYSNDLLSLLEHRNYHHDYYRNAGAYEFYIYSKLDDSYIRIGTRTPSDYDRNKAYPVFLALSTANEDWHSWLFPSEKMMESCLCFDVTGRGYTGGSYVGEASTFEILEWIRKNYRIDEDRIYIMGSSNGGYAAWTITQNHPHLAAAVYPLVGYPQISSVENASNVPVYQLVSPKDHVFSDKETEVLKRLRKYHHYHQYNFKEMLHFHIMNYIYHSDILNRMLQQKRDLYPERIIYQTERNRHLESFWIRMHGIDRGKKLAKIKAVIESENHIRINIHNARGFTLTIPPQIARSGFVISVNGKKFDFKDVKQDKLIFSKGKKWGLAGSEPQVDYRKGTGLLDVYLGSLRIIIPDDASGSICKTIYERF